MLCQGMNCIKVTVMERIVLYYSCKKKWRASLFRAAHMANFTRAKIKREVRWPNPHVTNIGPALHGSVCRGSWRRAQGIFCDTALLKQGPWITGAAGRPGESLEPGGNTWDPWISFWKTPSRSVWLLTQVLIAAGGRKGMVGVGVDTMRLLWGSYWVICPADPCH